jgi:aryl-alcohol dehydrogenase-like predicted oxidoreductase
MGGYIHGINHSRWIHKEGKSNILLSNENAWGIMRFLEENKYHNLPRVKTIQNPYSLLNRLFENASSEIVLMRM